MKNLRELRKNRKITMKELGSALNLAESTISLYENGQRQPDFETITKIANYFNVTIDYLMGRENAVSPPQQEPPQQENTVRIIGRGGVVKEYKVTERERKMFEAMLEAESEDPDLKY